MASNPRGRLDRLLAILCLALWILSAGSDSPCDQADTCQRCLQAHPDCAWCFRPDQRGRHCRPFGLVDSQCGEKVFPRQGVQSAPEDPSQPPTQILPRRVLLRLRPGSKQRLEVVYRQSENHPLDLYYLMDLSHSMSDDKDNLVGLAQRLVRKMKAVTSRLRLGFGSFVEKVALPYVDVHPKGSKGYAAPYGYRHLLALDSDTDKFRLEVERAPISGNYDSPEGGLDALVQAVVCRDRIGWRNDSRKLLVFSTDAGYHFAGDGKLAGVVEPNDGRCHLDRQGEYTEGLRFDYPSVGQLRRLVLEHKINVVFAVTKDQTSVYRDLSAKLDGSGLGTLDSNSNNVVELVHQQYKEITSSVKLTDTAPDPLRVVYFSSCVGWKEERTDTCRKVPVGGRVTFQVEIGLTSCPEASRRLTFRISPTHLNQAVEVEVEPLCHCPCQTPPDPKKTDPECSDRGSLRCGLCSCLDGSDGRKCECQTQGNASREDPYDQSPCFREGDPEPCSGRGKCLCGQCYCYFREDARETVSGSHCQCDNFSCQRVNGLPCGGTERGLCQCGKCICRPGWTGPDCNCPDSQRTCVDPENGKVCNGRGECKCGECRCRESEEESFGGPYCRHCLGCPGSCAVYGPCAACKIFGPRPCPSCPGIYQKLAPDDPKPGGQQCVFDQPDGCRIFFTYGLDSDGKPLIHVRAQRECSKRVDPLAVGLGVAGGVVAAGLLALLIWKLLTVLHDSREYARFLKEVADKKWTQGGNPLYKEATSTFRNPAFQSGD